MAVPLDKKFIIVNNLKVEQKKRRLIFYISWMAFILLGGMGVAYAYGYKFDFLNFRFIKTAAIQIRANISGNVLLNDKLVGRTSFLSKVFSVDRLLPGNYSLKFQKENYGLWEKVVNLKAGFVIDYEHVVVIPEQIEPQWLASPSVELIGLVDAKKVDNPISPDKNKSFVYTDHEIWVKWLNDSGNQPLKKAGDIDLITRFSNKLKYIEWYYDSNHLIANVGGTIILLEIDTRGGVNMFNIYAAEDGYYYNIKENLIYLRKGGKYQMLTLE